MSRIDPTNISHVFHSTLYRFLWVCTSQYLDVSSVGIMLVCTFIVIIDLIVLSNLPNLFSAIVRRTESVKPVVLFSSIRSKGKTITPSSSSLWTEGQSICNTPAITVAPSCRQYRARLYPNPEPQPVMTITSFEVSLSRDFRWQHR